MPRFLARAHLPDLFTALADAGYRCVGPTVRDGAIVYDRITGVADLPRGVHDAQAPGRYRLREGDTPRHFAWANGAQCLKPLSFAPEETLWRATRADDGRLCFEADTPAPPPTAVLGVRACDLAALELQTRHFADDPHFQARRRALLLIAVHCSHPAATCFCASTGDGPAAADGFDLALHELDEGYLVTTGSAAGRALADALPLSPATTAQQAAARAEVEAAAAAQTRRLPGRDLRDALFARLDHPRWQDAAARCLSCGNCTAVCPSCFCHAQRDEPDLDGRASRHRRLWDSCFTAGHSYLHGIVLRDDTARRYRQWLTHKLAGWHDQYGRSGCTGCGRCVTWCPAGIDLTAEVAALLAGAPEAAHD